MDVSGHIPVLVTEVLTHLLERPEQTEDAIVRGADAAPLPEQRFIDGTVGQGGHARELLARGLPGCRLLGFDRDPANLAISKERLKEFGNRVVLVNDSYANVKRHASAENGFNHVDGVLLDLGFSSAHVDDPQRGFSFMADGPLDMRYDPAGELTAEGIINGWSLNDLTDIFRVYGEEPAALQIAKTIYAERKRRKITTTLELADLVETVVHRHGKIHPATRIFQALRIAVNDELGELQRALPDFTDLLKPGGRIVIISFHSLEDRMIKRFFTENPTKLRIINKRIITASEEEIRQNPRSRSAKLRVAERI